MLCRSLVGIVALALAQPACAQERDFNTTLQYWLDGAKICMNARQSETLPLEEKVQVCNTVGAMLDRKSTEPDYAPRNDAEANAFWLARSSVYTFMQGIYGDEDGVLSRRVCTMVRNAKQARDNIKVSAWPTDAMREATEKSLASTERAFARCSANFPDL